MLLRFWDFQYNDGMKNQGIHGDAIRFLVSGRVQGVGFRYSTMEMASRLGLGGWTRNLPDGRVEVVAQGPDHALEDLGRWLQEGPAFARVEAVKSSPIHLTEPQKEFTIRR